MQAAAQVSQCMAAPVRVEGRPPGLEHKSWSTTFCPGCCSCAACTVLGSKGLRLEHGRMLLHQGMLVVGMAACYSFECKVVLE